MDDYKKLLVSALIRLDVLHYDMQQLVQRFNKRTGETYPFPYEGLLAAKEAVTKAGAYVPDIPKIIDEAVKRAVDGVMNAPVDLVPNYGVSPLTKVRDAMSSQELIEDDVSRLMAKWSRNSEPVAKVIRRDEKSITLQSLAQQGIMNGNEMRQELTTPAYADAGGEQIVVEPNIVVEKDYQ